MTPEWHRRGGDPMRDYVHAVNLLAEHKRLRAYRDRIARRACRHCGAHVPSASRHVCPACRLRRGVRP